MTVEQIAQMCHEANRAYCATIGDDSQAAWADAPEWQKDSAIAGVKAAIDNPNQTPELSHESWCDQKYRAGWLHGEVKDPIAKRHPCLVPYDELPIEQRRKDYLFLSVVRAFHPVIAPASPPPTVIETPAAEVPAPKPVLEPFLLRLVGEKPVARIEMDRAGGVHLLLSNVGQTDWVHGRIQGNTFVPQT